MSDEAPTERDVRANMILRQRDGIEMTPAQFAAEKKRIYADLRAALTAKGWVLPDSDEEFRRLISRAMKLPPRKRRP